MSILNIPTAIGSAISSLTAQHGHKKGVHGGGSSNPLNSTASSASAGTDGQPSGSAQSLFGALLDSAEQVVGIQTASPASITAAQAALKQV